MRFKFLLEEIISRSLEIEYRSEIGKAFQVLGQVQKKPQGPSVTIFVFGTSIFHLPADRSILPPSTL